MNYPLAPQGVFKTIQGEGVMLGVPMIFIRLAGCPVGCPQCDTDYSVAERVDEKEIARRVIACADGAQWVWLTGGEPTIHDLPTLVCEMRKYAFRTAVATSGINTVLRGWGRHLPHKGGVEFVSVSPHTVGDEWVHRRGDQLNVVPGLNGLKLEDFKYLDLSGFDNLYVTPMAPGGAVDECVDWVTRHPNWKLGVQAHKVWGLA